MEGINEAKNWFFDKVNKNDKALSWTDKEKERF